MLNLPVVTSREFSGMMDDGEYPKYERKECDPMECTEERDHFGLKRDLLREQSKLFQQMAHRLEQEKQKGYALIKMQLSKESLTIVIFHDDFDKADKKRDPRMLYNSNTFTESTQQGRGDD